MCDSDEALAVLACLEEGPPGEASPVEEVELSEWAFEGLRSHRIHRRETALGLGVAICLHVVVPALVVLLSLLLTAPSLSGPPVVTVSLVSLAGAGTGIGGAPRASRAQGLDPAGSKGKNALPHPVQRAFPVQRKAQTMPQNVISHPAKPVERISIRKPVHSRRARIKAARAPHPGEVPSEPPGKHASAPGGALLVQSVPACGAGPGSTGGSAGGDSLLGARDGGVRGFGTGSGGLNLGQVDTPPVPIKKEQPEFPDEARQMDISGRVVLKFLVEADGKVARISVISARPAGVFNRSAMEAIGKWRFKPGLYRGKPVAVWVELPVSFRLSR